MAAPAAVASMRRAAAKNSADESRYRSPRLLVIMPPPMVACAVDGNVWCVGVWVLRLKKEEGDGEERWKASMACLGLGLACPKALPSVRERGREASARCAGVYVSGRKYPVEQGQEACAGACARGHLLSPLSLAPPRAADGSMAPLLLPPQTHITLTQSFRCTFQHRRPFYLAGASSSQAPNTPSSLCLASLLASPLSPHQQSS